MSALKEKIKAWLLSHVTHPEKLEPIDYKLIDFMVDTFPQFVMQIVQFSILIFIYMWLYNKYGFERIVILLLCNLIFVIGMLRKALLV
jgi:hypothetical protein